jgi:uridine phosphorylase
MSKGQVQWLNTDFPTDPEGRTHHVGLGPGECSNLVLTVGSHGRAEKIAKRFFETIEYSKTSHRAFTSITGTYKGKRVTIVAIGMGSPNMDFFVRECRHVVEGPMAIIRVGTCGNLGTMEELPTAHCSISDKVMYVYRDPDTISYKCSKFVEADQQLAQLLMSSLPEGRGHMVSSISADTFYSSQGRTETDFVDNNADLIATIRKEHPEVLTCEMEHFWLLHLAKCSKPGRKVYAAGLAIVVGQRQAKVMITKEEEHEAEEMSGQAALDALVAFQFPAEDQ